MSIINTVPVVDSTFFSTKKSPSQCRTADATRRRLRPSASLIAFPSHVVYGDSLTGCKKVAKMVMMSAQPENIRHGVKREILSTSAQAEGQRSSVL